MFVTLLEIVTLARRVQDANAEVPMLATPVGIARVVTFVQEMNAEAPMLVTLGGMARLLRPQELNAYEPMLVRLPGNVKLTSRRQLANVELKMNVVWSGIETLRRFEHSANAPLPMWLTLSGTVTSVRLAQ